jgi:hypothetical protein
MSAEPTRLNCTTHIFPDVTHSVRKPSCPGHPTESAPAAQFPPHSSGVEGVLRRNTRHSTTISTEQVRWDEWRMISRNHPHAGKLPPYPHGNHGRSGWWGAFTDCAHWFLLTLACTFAAFAAFTVLFAFDEDDHTRSMPTPVQTAAALEVSEPPPPAPAQHAVRTAFMGWVR